MEKFIMVFGLPRTGTTWAFNVVKSMLDAEKTNYQSGFAVKPSVNWVDNPDTVLVKTHTPWRTDEFGSLLESGSARLIMSVRNPQDAIASQVRVMRSQGKRPKKTELIEKMLVQYQNYSRAFANYPKYIVIDEADIENDAITICNGINSYCNFSLSNKTIKDIASQYTRENVAEKINNLAQDKKWQGNFNEYDSNTHWHDNHISNENNDIEWSGVDKQLFIQINKLIDQFKNNSNIRERIWSPNAHNLINSYISS